MLDGRCWALNDPSGTHRAVNLADVVGVELDHPREEADVSNADRRLRERRLALHGARPRVEALGQRHVPHFGVLPLGRLLNGLRLPRRRLLTTRGGAARGGVPRLFVVAPTFRGRRRRRRSLRRRRGGPLWGLGRLGRGNNGLLGLVLLTWFGVGWRMGLFASSSAASATSSASSTSVHHDGFTDCRSPVLRRVPDLCGGALAGCRLVVTARLRVRAFDARLSLKEISSYAMPDFLTPGLAKWAMNDRAPVRACVRPCVCGIRVSGHCSSVGKFSQNLSLLLRI